MRVAGAILAGGEGRRMAGIDKPLADLAGESLVARVAARLAPQVETLVLNANGDPARFAFLGLPVVADRGGAGGGPLSGLATMLAHRRAEGGADRLATSPADTPFLPLDLVDRLGRALEGAPKGAVAVARSGGRLHPVAALWPVALAPDLDRFLASAENRSFMAFLAGRIVVTADFEIPADGPDPFLNVNTPQDLERARAFLAR